MVSDVFSPTGFKHLEVSLLYVLAMFRAGAFVQFLRPGTGTVQSSLDKNTDDGKQNGENTHQVYSGYTKDCGLLRMTFLCLYCCMVNNKTIPVPGLHNTIVPTQM